MDIKRPCHQEQGTFHQPPVKDNNWGLGEPMTSWRMHVWTDSEDHVPLTFFPNILMWRQDLEILKGKEKYPELVETEFL